MRRLPPYSIALLLLVGACSSLSSTAATTRSTTSQLPPSSSPSLPVTPTLAVATHPTAPPVTLVSWHGSIEELFVHPLVLDPRKAFTQDALGHGFADYFVTAREFRGILDGLWRNGWTLVDAHRAAAGTVRVPPGRRPLVLSEDDVNYYDYFTGRGLADRLVLDSRGEVVAQAGVRLTRQDVVPLVEDEVRAHPEFSADGAKGVLALTGYQGLFGEHDLTDPVARERVRALADRLRATGWSLASHTFGHITLARASLATVTRDTQRWRALTGDLLGPVDLFVYPFGSRPSDAELRYLRTQGFRVMFDIDVRSHRVSVDGIVVLSRRHVDGFAFDVPKRLAPFFDVTSVRDPDRPR